MSMNFLAGWKFDTLSFWLGFFLAGLIFLLFFRLRRRLGAFRDALTESYRTGVEALTTSAGQGYRTDLMRVSQFSHLSAHLFALEEILVPPRFLLPPVLLDPSQPGEYDAPALFPYMPDWPQLAEAYGAPNIPLLPLLTLKTSTIITGLPGSGKSTALAALAIEWLHRSADPATLTPEMPRAVFYANALDMNLPAPPKDLLAPLANAVQQHVSSLSASQVLPHLKSAVRAEGTVLLLDAVDELPFSAQAEFRRWVQEMRSHYPRIRFIITIAPDETDGWRPLGFAEVSPAPWSSADCRKFLEQWGTRWQENVSSDRKLPEKPDPSLLTGWINRQTPGSLPLDVTLRAWAAFSADIEGSNAAADQQAYINRQMAHAAEEALGQLAHTMVADGFSNPTRKQVETAMALAWPHSEQSLPPVEDALEELFNRGVMRRRAGNRASFGHLVIAAHVCALSLANEENLHAFLAASDSPLAEMAARAFAAGNEAATLVSARLAPVARHEEGEDPGMVHMPPLVEDAWRTLSVAAWLRDASPTAPWRAEIFRRLMKLLRSPGIPFPLRARALCAFLHSRDTSSLQLFRQLVGAADTEADASILAALGLGAMQDQSAVETLVHLLESTAREVRWAGALALGRIASKPALDALGQALLQGEDDLRRAAGEALSLDPVEGFAMLREAITDSELLVRRAAVFGLSRTAQGWALEILERVQLEDGQWAVKSAAAQAVEKMHGDVELPLGPLPAPSELPWLVNFAVQRKTGVAPGAPALAMLQRALREGTLAERAAAVDFLGRQADRKFMIDLVTGLGDNDAAVRDQAFAGLWALQILHPEKARDSE
jgi:HEAT repeat protein